MRISDALAIQLPSSSQEIAECLNTTVAALYEETDEKKDVSSKRDIQKRFENYNTYYQGCIVGYMDRLDDEVK